MSKHKEYVCLIGIDERDEAERAFDFYIKSLHRPTNKVVLVHACEPFIMSSNELAVTQDAVRAKALVDEKSRMKSLQEKYEEKMKTNGVKGRLNIIYYSQQPGKIICQIAKEDKCSLIVIGCRDAEPGRLRRYGETIDYVMKKADCPVVVARRKMAPVVVETRRGSDSHSFLGGQRAKTDDKSQKQRRISLPAKLGFGAHSSSTPAASAVPLSTARSSSAVPSTSSSSDSAAEARQRRHSSIANPMSTTSTRQHFTARRLSTRDEEPELEELINRFNAEQAASASSTGATNGTGGGQQ